jgi:hypothetical protein
VCGGESTYKCREDRERNMSQEEKVGRVCDNHQLPTLLREWSIVRFPMFSHVTGVILTDRHYYSFRNVQGWLPIDHRRL